MRPVEWFSRKRGGGPLEAAPRTLEAALGALDGAIRRQRHDGSHDGSDDESLRTLIVAYCQHARDAHLTPERMLIRLKNALDETLVVATDDPIARQAMRTHVIQLAIDSYYDDRR